MVTPFLSCQWAEAARQIEMPVLQHTGERKKSSLL